jgi:hypothetical protein
MIKNGISVAVQRMLAARFDHGDAIAKLDEQGRGRIQTLALGWAVAAGAIAPIPLALVVGPLVADAANGSMLVRVLVNAVAALVIFVVASAVHGALLYLLARREASR